MIVTLTTLARSLADYLAPVLTGFTFYEDPSQQRLVTPCAFLQTRYGRWEQEVGGYWIRTLGLDLTCLEDYNLPNLQQRYQRTAEALDEVMARFPYSDGSDKLPVLLRAHDRDWRINLDALHYKFELRLRVHRPAEAAKMQDMELKLILNIRSD